MGSRSSTSPGCSWRSRRPPRTSSPTSPRSGSTSPSSRPTGSSSSTTSTWSAARWQETGDWDLDGLFMRIGAAIDAVGAKRVVIDTIETLFGAFSNTAILRSELRRLFGWLKDRGVTVGDHRRARRRHAHPPRHRGVRLGLRDRPRPPCDRADVDPAAAHPQVPGLAARDQRVPVPHRRDRVSRCCRSPRSVSATACPRSGCPPAWPASTRCSVTEASTRGAPSSSAAPPAPGSRRWRRSSATRPAAADDEPCTSPSRSPRPRSCATWRRSASICRRWVDAGLLQFQCFRPSLLGLEAHLFAMQKFVGEFDPAVVVIDPISDLVGARNGRGRVGDADPSGRLPEGQGRDRAVHQPELTSASSSQADQQMTSLVDTWLLVKTMEGNGEHNRVLYVLKSRGMAHSNQIREFLLTGQGIELADVYVGPQGVLTGSARQAQEAKERSDGTARLEDLEQRRVNLERRRESVEAQTATLWREFEDEADIVRRLLSHGSTSVEDRAGQRAEQGRLRRADTDKPEDMRRRSDDSRRNVVSATAVGPPTPVTRRRAAAPTTTDERWWYLRLYVAGQSPKSLRAFANLKELCEEHLAGHYEIEIIDLVENPSLARRRRHPRHPDARPPPPAAAAQDHRRPVRHRTRPRRPPGRAGVAAMTVAARRDARALRGRARRARRGRLRADPVRQRSVGPVGARDRQRPTAVRRPPARPVPPLGRRRARGPRRRPRPAGCSPLPPWSGTCRCRCGRVVGDLSDTDKVLRALDLPLARPTPTDLG